MSGSDPVVILSAARTPLGRFQGDLSSFSGHKLGSHVIGAALERANLAPERIDEVFMGCVLPAGQGQAPARQAARGAKLPDATGATTINKVCGSGMKTVMMAAQAIRLGDANVVVAGGMESMSNAPYLLANARFGYRYGNDALIDEMVHDGLLDAYFDEAMASQSARVAAELGVTRAVQDQFAYQSHARAHAAHEAGHFAAEIAPIRVATKAKGKIVVDALPVPARERVPVPAGRAQAGIWNHVPPPGMVADPARFGAYVTGDVPATLVDRDEPVRAGASLEAMSKLAPLDAGGTITAGNAPGVNDGAAALVLASVDYAKRNGLEALATIEGHAGAAWDPPYLALTPAMAAQKLLDRLQLAAADIAVWEVNEAFAAVALTAAARLGLDPAAINLQGGAVALGHPLGASGARIVASVVHQLRRRGGGLGIAAICSGGGQGDALLVRVG